MEKLWTYFLSLSYGGLLLLGACAPEGTWYQKEFTEEQQIQLSEQLVNLAGDGRTYRQGTVPDQFIIAEALKHNPKNAAAWREEGIPYLKRGFPKEFYKYYERVVAYNPTEWQGWRGYLYLYFYRDFRRAIADFNATDTLTPNFTDYPQGQSVDYMRGIAYYGLGDYERANDYFTRYIDEVTRDEGEDWVDTYAFLYRGLTQEKRSNVDSALADLDKVIRYDQNLSDAYYHQSRIYYQQGDYSRAEQLRQQAQDLFARGYFHQRPYVEVLGQIYQEDLDQLARRIQRRLRKFD